MKVRAMQVELDRILSEAVASGDVAHAAGIVVDADGLLYQGQAGPRRLGADEPLADDSVFWIHSMTKPLTAAAVMQLVEQGRIGLDDDCGAVLDSLAAPRVLEGFRADGQPRLRPAQGRITLRRLLTHTAGFVYETWNADQLNWMKQSGVDRLRFYGDSANCPPLAFDPGERWEYGINIDWAGKVLEAITGETLEAYLRTHLLEPLGMTSTGYVLSEPIRKRLSGVHQRDRNGVIHAIDFEPPKEQDPTGFTGGGGMFGSAADYGRFMRMILNRGTLDGVQVLEADTVALMGQNHTGKIPVTGLPTAMPERSFAFDFFPGIEKRWGLSFMIVMDDVPGRRKAGSLAWAGLRNTYFWIDPASGIGAALFTQMLPFADPKTLAVLDRFESAIYAVI